jgi:hypothetical protein
MSQRYLEGSTRRHGGILNWTASAPPGHGRRAARAERAPRNERAGGARPNKGRPRYERAGGARRDYRERLGLASGVLASVASEGSAEGSSAGECNEPRAGSGATDDTRAARPTVGRPRNGRAGGVTCGSDDTRATGHRVHDAHTRGRRDPRVEPLGGPSSPDTGGLTDRATGIFIIRR